MPSTKDEPRDSPLLAVLRERILREGPLSLDAFMQICMSDPEHGYWCTRRSIGAEGDFTTAPEISQVFGEIIGLWSAMAWDRMGRPTPLRLVELGPGRGTLMRDALRSARLVPEFLDAARVHLIEVSPALRAMQRQLLASRPGGPPVEWHPTLDSVPDGPAIVIGNEFLDVLPIRQLVFRDGVWRERVVETGSEGALRFGLGGLASFASRSAPQQGDIVELRAGEEEVLACLAQRASPLIALLIDYGPEEMHFGDTLQAVRRHAYVDPLAEPGEADLTAHVQFAGLRQKAQAAGLAADGPMTQAEFFGRLGMVERAARLMAANPAEAGGIEAAVQRLLAPHGMGGRFKVLAVRSPELPPLEPFT
jgi:SAM-dependent MidA family methyltransferase